MYPQFVYGSFQEEEKVEGSTQSLFHTASIEEENKLTVIPKGGGTTLLEGWSKSVESFPDNNCLGHIEGDKYVWRTYKEADHEAKCLAKAIFSENLISDVMDDGKPLKIMGIYSRNRPEWALINWAVVHFAGTVTTLYNTLGEASLSYAVDHTELSIISWDKASLTKLLSLKKDGKIETLKTIIAFDEVEEQEIKELEENGIKLFTFSDLIKRGESIDDKVLDEMPKPTPETTEVIWFTSGTTGMPKGGKICHKNFTANIRGCEDSGIIFNEKDTIISYLPLAHWYEKWLMATSLWRGVAIGYFNGNPLTLIKDIQLLRPTLMAAVPRVLTKLYDTINLMMAKEDFKNKLYKVALEQKLLKIKNECKFTHLLWDSILFKYHKGILGGRVRLMITGSAPISPDILNALKCNFSIQIHEGYGQTETNAPSTITWVNDSIAGHVGGPISCVKVKLEDLPDMDYLSTDKPYPRGELCIKGHCVFQGYFRNEEKNREAFDEEGWLHTGDVAEIWDNGAVRLIDRKKNLFKLSQGEYISPEKLENVYNKSLFVAQIFVHGFSVESYCVAIIVPDPDYIKLWATKLGIDKDIQEILGSQELKDSIVQDFKDRAAKSNLNSLEKITKFRLIGEMFSVQNGLITPSFKLVRHEAKKRFKDIVQQLYDEE